MDDPVIARIAQKVCHLIHDPLRGSNDTTSIAVIPARFSFVGLSRRGECMVRVEACSP